MIFHLKIKIKNVGQYLQFRTPSNIKINMGRDVSSSRRDFILSVSAAHLSSFVCVWRGSRCSSPAGCLTRAGPRRDRRPRGVRRHHLHLLEHLVLVGGKYSLLTAPKEHKFELILSEMKECQIWMNPPTSK